MTHLIPTRYRSHPVCEPPYQSNRPLEWLPATWCGPLAVSTPNCNDLWPLHRPRRRRGRGGRGGEGRGGRGGEGRGGEGVVAAAVKAAAAKVVWPWR